MSTSTAPLPVTLCPHLLENLNQSLALIADPTPAYMCASCTADACEDRLLSSQSAASVADAIHFNCDHGDGCIACREGIVAQLKLRRWAAYWTDNAHGNRLAEVIKRLIHVDAIPAPVPMSKRTAKPKKPKKYWGGRWHEDEREPVTSALCNRSDIVVVPAEVVSR